MEEFLVEAKNILKQVVSTVGVLQEALSEQKSEINVLNGNVSKLKKVIEVLFQHQGIPIETITESLSDKGTTVPSPDNPETVEDETDDPVLNYPVEDETMNDNDIVESSLDDVNDNISGNLDAAEDEDDIPLMDEDDTDPLSPTPSTEESDNNEESSDTVQDISIQSVALFPDEDVNQDIDMEPRQSTSSTVTRKSSRFDTDELRSKRNVTADSDSDKSDNDVKPTVTPTKESRRATRQSSQTSRRTTGRPRRKVTTRDKSLSPVVISDSDSDAEPKKDSKDKLMSLMKLNREHDPKKVFVKIETLQKVILDRLETHKCIELYSGAPDDGKRNLTRGRKGRSQDDDPLVKAIKQLCAFMPIIPERTQTVTKKKTHHGKKSSKKENDDEIFSRTDESNSDADIEESKGISSAQKTISSVEDLEKDPLGSDDDEYLDAAVESDESTAKKAVLGGDDEKSVKVESDADSGESGKKKKKKDSGYYTPKVCRLSKEKDSDVSKQSDDDDDFNKIKTRKKKGKKTVIASDSDEDIQSCSEEDSTNKKKKRKRTNGSSSSDAIVIDSDDSSGSDTRTRTTRSSKRNEPHSDSKKQKRLKRIKQVSDDSDEDDDRKKKKKGKGKKQNESDDGEEATISKAHRRRDIHEIISKKDQQKQTRQAQDDEQKRKDRVAKQKLFNKFEFSSDSTESTSIVVKSLVLDVDKTTKEPLISLDPEIVKKLKPHQARGISFLWDSCFESLEQYKKPNNEGSGCILAHCMGLGKTLQTIGFLHSVMTSELLTMKTALVICPLNTVGNWANELKMWLRDVDTRLNIHELYKGKNIDDRVHDLEFWHRKGGVGILHYDRFRELVGEGKRIKKKYQPRIKKCLLDPGPDLIICDEAHIIKNCRSKISLAINQIKTKRRILLTGTPLQNNLTEYHTMMQFVKPNLLGSIKEFRNRFVNPITNGQHRDSNDHDVRVMKKRAHVLHKLLDGCVQRLDYSVLVPYLPPKYEYVLLIKMTEIQKQLYKHYLTSVMGDEGSLSVANRIKQRKFLADFAILSKVWSHPYSLTLKHNEGNNDSDSEGSLKDFIDDDESEALSTPSASTDSSSDVEWLDDVKKKMKKKKENEKNEQTEESKVNSATIIEQGGDWWSQFFKSKDDVSLLEHGSKLVLLFEILKTCESIGDKVLIFSQSLNSLNIIENFLEDLDNQARKESNGEPIIFGTTPVNNLRWRKDIEYYRIDGSTKTEDRQKSCDKFNKTDFNNVKLFLISTRAGGLGINLVGANRVVIFDASWNPSQDLQSIFRVFRFGQTKPCYIYRFLAQGTMEEKVYNRQVVKLSLSGRVVDEHQIERHFKFDDILKMYDCDFDQKPDRPTPPVPKDRLLADLLISHKDILDTYLEHDSLLVNQADEGLSEEERKIAWNEYQNEKDSETRQQAAMASNQEMNEKMRAKLRELYPFISDGELAQYVWKINQEIRNLKIANQSYALRLGQLSEADRQIMVNSLSERRGMISRYLSEPNFLANVMATQASHSIQVQSPYPGLLHVPQMRNNFSESPAVNYLTQSFANIAQNMGVGQLHHQLTQPQQRRPISILSRSNNTKSSLPTTTVPYNPNIPNMLSMNPLPHQQN